MAVYVDDMHMKARVGRIEANWSHMMADSLFELQDMARQIGLRPAWLQNKQSGVHYDVTDSVRRKAVRAGAIEIETRSDKWVEVVAKARSQYNPLD